MEVKVRIFLYAIALTVTSLLVTETLLYLTNSLDRHSEWRPVTGTILELMGRREYFSSRKTLAQNRLDLSAWFGHKGIESREIFEPRELAFDYQFAEAGGFYVFFGQKDSYHGVYFSTSRPSAFAHMKESGEFIEYRPLELSIPVSGQIKIEFFPEEATISVGQKKTMLPGFGSTGRLSFRAEDAPVFIDNIEFIGTKKRLFEGFRNTASYMSLWLWCLGALCLLSLVLGMLGSFLGSPVIYVSIESLVSIFLVSAGLYIVDYNYWSTQYYPINLNEDSIGNRVEVLRRKFEQMYFRKEKPREVIKTVDQNCKVNFPFRADSGFFRYAHEVKCGGQANNVKGVFIGTSQTWGAGARSYLSTFVGLTGGKLLERGCASRLYNYSVSSSNSLELHGFFQEHLPSDLDFVVINLGFNDSPQMLQRGMPKLIRMAQKNAKRVFVLTEPSQRSQANSTTWIRNSMESGKALTGGDSLKLIDFEKHIASIPVEDGIMWWDVVHFSPYGHQRAAEFLYHEIVQGFCPSRGN